MIFPQNVQYLVRNYSPPSLKNSESNAIFVLFQKFNYWTQDVFLFTERSVFSVCALKVGDVIGSKLVMSQTHLLC